MTTYTVINRSGEAEYRGLTSVEAAQQKLWHDGGDYEMRRSPQHDIRELPGKPCWELWHRDGGQGHKWGAIWTGSPGNYKPAIIWEADADAAFAALAEAIIYSDWRYTPEIMTDDSWMKMQVELAVEEGLL